MPPRSVLLFGTCDMAARALTALVEAPAVVGSVEVVCPPDRRTGRGRRLQPVPVKRRAMELGGIPVHHTPENTRTLKRWAPPPGPYDLGVVVSFGYLIRPHILDVLRHGAINMHPSLLPRHRGAAPVHHTLLAGDAETGVSIIKISAEIDAGNVLLQRRVPVRADHTLRSLSAELGDLGAQMLVEAAADLPALEAAAVVQDDSLATPAPKVGPEMGALDAAAWTADEALRRWRALGDNVGVRAPLCGLDVKLTAVAPAAPELLAGEGVADAPPGALLVTKRPRRALLLRCADAWVELARVQPAGKAEQAGEAFANGRRLGVGVTV